MSKYFLCGLCLFFYSTSFAVKVSKQVQPDRIAYNKIIQVLSLPSKNRNSVFNKLLSSKSKDKNIYNHVREAAFDGQLDLNIRWRAVMGMAQLRGAESWDDLVKAAHHKDWFLRNAALISMHRVSPTSVKPWAKEMLKDSALVVRTAAVEMIDQLRAIDMKNDLWQAINDKQNFRKGQSLWIRPIIARTLYNFTRVNDSKVQWYKLLDDNDLVIKNIASLAIKRIEGQSIH